MMIPNFINLLPAIEFRLLSGFSLVFDQTSPLSYER